MIALSLAQFEIKSISPFTTMLLDIFFPQWLHWSHEAWHDRIIHPHTLFQFLLKCFFLMAIICLNISISTICNWVFLRNSACPLCWWYLYRFCFVYFFPLLHISCWASCWQHCWRTRPGRRRCGGSRREPSAAWSRTWIQVSRWLPCWRTGGSTEHCMKIIFLDGI